MSKPNKAFTASRKKFGFSEDHMKRKKESADARMNADVFMNWFFDQVQNKCKTFVSVGEVRAVFESS